MPRRGNLPVEISGISSQERVCVGVELPRRVRQRRRWRRRWHLGTGGGGGGGGGSSGGDIDAKPVAGDTEDLPALDTDVIVLHVGGMVCGGCASSVKRILESLPQVSSATVNLEKEMALIWVVREAKVTQGWQQEVGETLAKHLTTCGFKSNLQDLDCSGVAA